MKDGAVNKPIPKKKRPRTCVGCMEESPKRALMRVVRISNEEVKYDPTGRADGRGAYVCSDVQCIKAAKKKKAFTRALKIPVDNAIYDLLEEICLNEQKTKNA
ncbi:MAG: YlxR family protein [Synergistaceae bacterium]|nr:YlxR family protein [Synergistaceae bacterium]